MASFSVRLPDSTTVTVAPRSFMRKTLRLWRRTSSAPMKISQRMPKSAATVAVATPSWPAPVPAPPSGGAGCPCRAGCPPPLGSFGAADELFDLGMVLPPGAGLHPGRDVDGEGAHGAHDQGHRVGMEPARDEETRGGQPGGGGAVERDARATRLAGDEAVEQEIVGRIARGERGEVDARARADRLDRPPAPAAAVVGVLVAVELERGEADPRRDLLDQGARRVDEDADQRRVGHGLRDVARGLGCDVARARGVEVEPQEVGAGGDRGARVLDRAHAADLDLHGHRSHSARAAPGSGRSMNASPTSTACAPAAVMRRTSAAERSPLSATTSAPDGARGARCSAVARETSKVARSRLLMPMSVAPSAAARPSSASVCTSTRTSRPAAAPAAIRSAPCPAPTAATISSTASAPKARASSIWYEAISKSLRRQGSPEAARAATRCSSAPPKNGPSVSTESAAAPAAA